MPEDNLEIQVTPEEEKPKGNADIENIIRERLKQANQAHEKRMAEKQAELDELRKSNHAAMGAMPHQPAQAPGMPMQGGMPPQQPAMQSNGQPQLTAEEWYSIQQEVEKEKKLKQAIQEAAQKDKEFAALLNDGKGNVVPQSLAAEMSHLPNPAAVLKQLLKDGKSNAELWALLNDSQTRRVDVVRFINQLSDKIDNSVSKPHAPNYTPPVDTSDIGDTGQEYDISDLVAEHR